MNSLIRTKDEALTSLVIYNLYRKNTGHEHLTSEIRSRIEYLIPSISTLLVDENPVISLGGFNNK